MSKIFSSLLSLGLLLFTVSSTAQQMQQELDELRQTYLQQSDPARQIDILNEIAYTYRRINPDSVMKYAELAIARSQAMDYTQGLANAYKNKGIAFYKLGAGPDTTINCYQQAIAYAEEIEDYYTQAACLNNIALIQIYTLSYNEAIASLLKGVKIFDQYLKEESRLKALILGNLGTAYRARQDLERSIDYFEKALEIGKRINDKSISTIYVDELAMAKMETGKVQEAYDDVINILPLTDELGDMESKASFLITLADIEIHLKLFESSHAHALEALELAQNHNFTRKTIQALTVLSQGNAENGRIEAAIARGKEALRTSAQAKMFWYEARSLLLLSDLYAQNRDYVEAFSYLRQYNAVHERNRDQESQEMASRIEAEYQMKERQNQIELLKQEQLAQKNRIRLLWFASAFFLMLLFIGAYVYYLKWRTSRALNAKNSELARAEQQLYEKNTQLQAYIESNMQLENFAHLASHDLREPMRTIVSFSQLLEKRASTKLNADELEYLNFIQEGTRRIEKLINDLLTFAKINNSPANIEKVDLNEVLRQVQQDLHQLIGEKKAVIQIENPLPEFMLCDPARVYQLFQNLISNGIKYSREEVAPLITIKYRKGRKCHYFSITDNGIGIASEFYDRIFLLFKTLKSKTVSNSSGIGLATCKKIVEQMGGRIWVESIEGHGSIFYFNLPLSPDQATNSRRKRMLEKT